MQDPWDVPQHLVTAPDVCYRCPMVLTTWWHASGCFLGRAPWCSPHLQGLPPFPSRASRALCLWSQEPGKGARGEQGAEGSQGHAGSWGAARSQVGARQLFCCRQPPGQQTSPAGEEASHCCWEKVEQGNCSASIKKQPNLSFPTQRECYSADATCNEGMGLFLHSFQHSFPSTCKLSVLPVTFMLSQRRTAPGWR